MIQCKRLYLPPADGDGLRILVDRLWPRGVAKNALKHDHWLPEAAPSAALRQAFHQNHDFAAFRQAYVRELNAQPQHWQPLLHWAKAGPITLLYGARDEVHNNAQVLADFLEDELERHDTCSSPVCYQGEYGND